MADDLVDRVTLLERMADQQLFLNDLLSQVTARLEQEQGLHAERLARLDRVLEAIKDLLNRPNGQGGLP